MKKIILWITAVILCLCFPVGAAAQSAPEEPARLVDTADLLSATEETILLEQLNEISARQGVDLVIVTVNHLQDYEPEEFAKQYYKRNGYGQGLRKNGVMLLISGGCHIYAKGFGAKAVNANGEEYLREQITATLEQKEYAKAFSLFATEADRLVEMARQGQPYKPVFNGWLYLLIGLAAAVVVFLGTTFVLRRRKK